VHCDAERPYGILRAVTISREFSEQLLLSRPAHLDVVDPHPEVVLVATVGDVDVAIVAEAHGLRIVEARAVRRGSPNRMAPIVGSALDVGRKRHRLLPSLEFGLLRGWVAGSSPAPTPADGRHP